MDQEEIIELAKETHKQGDLATAEELYRQVLSSNQDDPDANHLLGVIHYQQKKYDSALGLIRKAVVLRPDHSAALNNLGSVQKELEMYDDALESFRKAIHLQPDFAEALNNLGTVYKILDRLDEAEGAYNDALDNQPDYVKALNNLGNLFQEKGDFSQALNWYGKALVIDPNLPLTHYNLGRTLLQLFRVDESEAALLQALAGEPQMVEALNMLGRLYCLRFQFDRSLDVLQQALSLQPESEAIFISFGNTYCNMGRYEEAAYFLEKAVRVIPDSSLVLNNLGLVYNFLGKMEDASKCLTTARKISPDNADIWCNIALLNMTQGLFEESAEACQKAIQINPECAFAYYQLAQVTRKTDTNELILAMQELLSRDKVWPMQQMQLQFGLAKLFEEQGKYSEAFVCLNKGNMLKRNTFEFSLDLHQKMVEKTCEIYNTGILQRFAGKGHKSKVPIFIVGMPRSGTTLVEQILASHPDVYGAGELQLLCDTVTNYLHIVSVDETIPPDICLREKDFPEIGQRYVDRLQSLSSESLRITDKMLGNYMHVGLIRLIFPNAVIIHCRRNPVDTCLSIYKKLFARGHQYAYNLEELGRFYLLYYQMMQYWRTVLGEQFLDFRYEELVRDQKGKTRQLLDYCGLEWNENCLQFDTHDRPVHTASAVQVRHSITSSSVELWKKYEEDLQPLLSILQPSLEDYIRQ